MKIFLLLVCGLGLFACTQKRNVTLNWYLRLEATEECPEFGLYAGSELRLCPVGRVVSNGDSIMLSSNGNCYFFRLEEYKDGVELPTIACADTVDLIKRGAWYWPK